MFPILVQIATMQILGEKLLFSYIILHPAEDTSACSQFYGSLFNNCGEISIKNHKCQPHGGTKGKVRGALKSVEII